jgi:hypothetical protein
LEQVAYMDAPPCLVDPQKWIGSLVFGTPTSWDLEGREREFALVKHSDWKYEKEWRFVWIDPPGTLTDFGDHPFAPGALVELIAGSRTDTAQSMELLALARSLRHDVKHFKMSPDPGRFDLSKSVG